MTKMVERNCLNICKIESDGEVTNMTEQILAAQKMQDYIEAHLTGEITLAALADITSMRLLMVVS